MNAFLNKLFLGIVFGALTTLALAANENKSNPHEILKKTPGPDCLSCHIALPQTYSARTNYSLDPKPGDFRADGTAMCAVCHGALGSHMVGALIDFPIPKDLPLTEQNILVCLTCHFVHGEFKSDRPWGAVSFMDRLVNNKSLHKSYLLRRNNSNGELCLICHNPGG